jgi:Flp pilus assembly protein TadG
VIRRLLTSDVKASTSVEFAVVGLLLCLVTFGVIETGLLWWLKSGMQLTASLTARCGAMGYTYNTAGFSCTSTTTTQNYAVATAGTWLMPNMVTAANVTVNGKVTSCNGFSGNFFSVSISSGFFTSLPPPLGNHTLSASACFPMK